MLNHCISRPSNRQRHRSGPFIDRYVFPDGELQGPGTVTGAMHDHGLEVRHAENLREHYAITLAQWAANLERNWSKAVAEIAERRARPWRLYIAASRVGFELGPGPSPRGPRRADDCRRTFGNAAAIRVGAPVSVF
jgi:cyclopropane-fatty-acyl-phospholipid synthase